MTEGPDEADRERLWQALLAERPRLLRIARSRTDSLEDAEDCVQEALLRCAEYGGLDEARLGRFLTTVTVNACTDRRRAAASDERLRRRLAGRRTDVDPLPDEVVADRDEARWVADLINDLPPRQQEVVRARAAGHSLREIAALTRMSYVAVESQLARASRTIKAALASTLTLGAFLWRRRHVVLGAAAVAVLGLTYQPGHPESSVDHDSDVVHVVPAAPPKRLPRATASPVSRPSPRATLMFIVDSLGTHRDRLKRPLVSPNLVETLVDVSPLPTGCERDEVALPNVPARTPICADGAAGQPR